MLARKKEIVDENPEKEILNNQKYKGFQFLEDVGKARGYIDTGILSLNYIISGKMVGGGVPEGTIIEFSGKSGTGKSLVAMNVVKGCQKANGYPVYLDAERAINSEFAEKAAKVDLKKCFITTTNTIEDSFNKVHKSMDLIRKELKIPLTKPLLIVYDSIAVSPSKAEFAETTIDMENASEAEKKKAGVRSSDQPGQRAKEAGKELRKLMPLAEENNATIVIINQIRNKIGISWGSPTTVAGGGEALVYYCSTRIEFSGSEKVKDKNDRIVACKMRFKNIKSRFVAPFQEVNGILLHYEKGIDPFSGLLPLLIQLGRIEGERGKYSVKEPYARGKVVKFTSSEKENNRIPTDILLEYPSLVDADSAEQIQYYIDLYGDAINVSQDQDLISELISEDEE